MRKKIRNHSAALKAKVALAAVRGDKTLSELSAQFDVHPNQITQWKGLLLDYVAELFQRGTKSSSDNDDTLTELPVKIGSLTMENDFLGKVLVR